jgi:superfamily I DNA/RNA helicase
VQPGLPGLDADALLEGLNPAQRQAVEAPDGPLLIFAGAGSGKTRVLTHRIAYVIATGRARADEICAVTFTNKAAREMRSRIEALLGGSVGGMWLGTFHALGVRLLRRDGEAIGIPPDFTIYDEGDRLEATKRAMAAAGVDERKWAPRAIVHAISMAKNELMDASEFAVSPAGLSYTGAPVAQTFPHYERELSRASALDFDDLLVRAVALLRDVPPVAEHYQLRFRHIFVDEYQDTNLAQYRLVMLLSAARGNLTVVGDDDQCVIAGTRVTMADGREVPVEAVRAGDMVLSSYGGGTTRPARVLRVASRVANTGVAVTLASGRRVVTTAEHTHFAGYRLGATPCSNRPSAVVTLCGDHRGRTPMHRVSTVGSDPASAEALRAAGVSVRPVRSGSGSWRVETVYADLERALDRARLIRDTIGAVVVLTARLGSPVAGEEAVSLPFIAASAVRPGMVMFTHDGGYDAVTAVEPAELDATVHDIDVEATHNFIANGIVTHNSIYGWRGADVRNILNFERDHPTAVRVTLDQNYRSTQTILDAAHHVIRHNPDRAPKKLWTDQGAGELVRLLSVYDEREEAQTVCAEVERLVGSEGFTLQDMAVLYRTNAQSRAFEDVLLRRGVPYRLVGGVRFYERREVKDVLAYLRLVANPRDAVSFTRVVNVPRRKIGDKTVQAIEKLARRRGVAPFEALAHLGADAEVTPAASAALDAFRALVERLRELSLSLSLPELIERVLDETGYERHLKDGTPEGEERWANVQELSGLAAEHADVEPPEGLRRFLETVALVSDVDTMDDNARGVTLITLHQVKGLEFGVVFMAGMEEGLLPHVRALEEGDAGIAEERRLAYVGMTRAQKRLYLLHAFTRHLYGRPQSATASRFLADLPAAVLELARRPGQVGAPPAPRTPGAVRDAIRARAVAPNPVEIAPQRFADGMRVRHGKYGEGTILKSTMTRSGEEVVIRFDSVGLKIFAVADARLEVIA